MATVKVYQAGEVVYEGHPEGLLDGRYRERPGGRLVALGLSAGTVARIDAMPVGAVMQVGSGSEDLRVLRTS